MKNIDQPVVLSIAGHDPGGGAGIQADIETIASLGGIPATAITCLTLQDTVNVREIVPVEPTLVGEQIACVLQDYQVRAIKIGLLGDPEIAAAVGDKLLQHPGIPLVLDPVLAAGGGTELAREGLIEAMQNFLFPRTALITPNSEEARRLTGEQQLGACAAKLLDQGIEAVLITGTHENSEEVVNQLYRPGLGVLALSWPRLEGSYHGSGCTLASAIATGLAAGHSLEKAVERGQQFTWSALKNATHPGRGQAIPNRRHQQEKH